MVRNIRSRRSSSMSIDLLEQINHRLDKDIERHTQEFYRSEGYEQSRNYLNGVLMGLQMAKEHIGEIHRNKKRHS
jgi:tartrate dehydratase alpha subunit/fumarate hydratase class I-like protein